MSLQSSSSTTTTTTTLQHLPSTPFHHLPRTPKKPDLLNLLTLCKNTKEIHQIHATLIKTNLIHSTTFTKNLMIRAHSNSQSPLSAISLYVHFLNNGFDFNKFAFSFFIQACLRSGSVGEGHQIHAQILKWGEMDAHLASAIIGFYSEIGDLGSARRVFENTRRFIGSWNSMVDGYAKGGEIGMACQLFDEMPQRSLRAWTALITGFVHLGRFREGLGFFQTMQKEGFKPDERTLVSILPCVSRLGALSLGKWVHSYVENFDVEMNLYLGSALVDMYSKCGSIESAIEVFDEIRPRKRNVVIWNAMISGLAMHGRGRNALELFEMMLASGVRPTDVTFVGILRACSHTGMVDQGLRYFEAMRDEYKIEPTIEHYGCAVDLLCRAGRLKEAEKLVGSTKARLDVVVLKTLLGACRVHGNIEIGERIGKELIELASGDSSCYVLLANLYASLGRWEDVSKVRNLMKERGVGKVAGCSSIELDSVVHEFHAGDMSHPRIEEIYVKLEELWRELKVQGYVPDTSQVLVDAGEEEKEAALFRHSEKLAIAFGLINTRPGSTIRIVKNLRVCLDCHSVTKLISKLYDREIIVRDQNRFHHFKNGLCSCNDYW